MIFRFVVNLQKAEQLNLFGPARAVPVRGHMRVTHGGTVATVAPHVRHITAAAAFRMKGAELRDHVQAGGPNAEVAQAELDRRRSKRPDTPASRARAAPPTGWGWPGKKFRTYKEASDAAASMRHDGPFQVRSVRSNGGPPAFVVAKHLGYGRWTYLQTTGEAAAAPEAIPGGPAAGMSPAEFEPDALARGTEHEKEHTTDPAIAQEIAMDHLVEDPAYYDGNKVVAPEPAAEAESLPPEGDEDEPVAPGTELVAHTPTVSAPDLREKERGRLQEYLADAERQGPSEHRERRIKHLRRMLRYLDEPWPPRPERGQTYSKAEMADVARATEYGTSILDLAAASHAYAASMSDSPGWLFMFGRDGGGQRWTPHGPVHDVFELVRDAKDTVRDGIFMATTHAFIRGAYIGRPGYAVPDKEWRTPETMRAYLGYVAGKTDHVAHHMRVWSDRELYRKPQAPAELQARLVAHAERLGPYAIEEPALYKLLEWHGYAGPFRAQRGPGSLIAPEPRDRRDLATVLEQWRVQEAAAAARDIQRHEAYLSGATALAQVARAAERDGVVSPGRFRHQLAQVAPGAKLEVTRYGALSGPTRLGMYEAVVKNFAEGWVFYGPKAPSNEEAVQRLAQHVGELAKLAPTWDKTMTGFYKLQDKAMANTTGATT